MTFDWLNASPDEVEARIWQMFKSEIKAQLDKEDRQEEQKILYGDGSEFRGGTIKVA